MSKKASKQSAVSIPTKIIENKIFLIRGQRIMIDHDLANLYGVTSKRLKEQIRRNLKRFPDDFMFKFTKNETMEVAAKCGNLHTLKYSPQFSYAFTEQGIAMLSSVLNSDRAIEVNIQIIRVFVKLKQILISHKDLEKKIENLERQYLDHDKKIIAIFQAMRQLLEPPQDEKKEPFGFRIRNKK